MWSVPGGVPVPPASRDSACIPLDRPTRCWYRPRRRWFPPGLVPGSPIAPVARLAW
jgi:hypothetical protein